MSIQDHPLELKEKKIPSLWDTLYRIQATLNLPDQEMADFMRLTRRDFSHLKSRKKEPSVGSIMAFAELINVGFESILINDIDYIALSKQFLGNVFYVPEKYTVGANSRRRTVINLLDYIEKRLGWEQRLQVLRRFQMTEAMFSDPNAEINLRLSVDICSWVLSYYRDETLIHEMGCNAVNTHRRTLMGQELSRAKNLREIFEMMCDFILEKYIERNFKWRIRFQDSMTCIMEGVPNQDLVPIIGESYVNSRIGCLVRGGFIASIPCYLDFPAVEIKKSKCVAQGDGLCRFELDFLPVVRKKQHLHSSFKLLS